MSILNQCKMISSRKHQTRTSPAFRLKMQTGCKATSRHAPSNLAVRLLASRCNEDARHAQHFVTRPLLDDLLYRVKAFRLKVQNDCTATSKDAASNIAGIKASHRLPNLPWLLNEYLIAPGAGPQRILNRPGKERLLPLNGHTRG